MAARPLRILVLKAGSASPALRLACGGDYDDWFRTAFGDEVEIDRIDAYRGEMLPLRGFDGAVMTGSPLSVTRPEPWMDGAGRFMREIAEQGTPFLGVCFGHQLLARTLGGAVEKNPYGREIGTIEISLTPEGKADPLFAGLEDRAAFQATHEDAVTRPPPGARILASNAKGLQAFAAGKRLWGVQFHPELDHERIGALIRSRDEALEREGLLERALASVRPSAHGRSLLANFVRLIRTGVQG